MKYLEYKLFSKHRKGHGIHSPFVFDLVSGVFRNKTDADIVFNIEKIRKKMLTDTRIINVNDLGAGSAKYKSSLRKLTTISRYSAIPEKYGILICNMAKSFGKPHIIEFGTSLGISALYLAAGDREVAVYTIEGCRETSAVAAENFKEAGCTNITLFNTSFEDFLVRHTSEILKPGLVFIDGNHRKEPVIKYFNLMAEVSDSSTVIMIDDIYSSVGMYEAWSKIKKHRKVTFTVDIFRMGIVFFREGVNHFDYVIRY